MRRTFLLILLVGLTGTRPLIAARDTSHDTHPLSVAEAGTFLPLSCANPMQSKKPDLGPGTYDCQTLIGYPTDLIGADGEAVIGDEIALQAIAYGGFSGADQDEAYVTYASPREPHSLNYGGGILFRRSAGNWSLVRWYPGGQMGQCVAVPGVGPVSLLCLDGYTGQGEVDSSIWVKRLPTTPDGAAAPGDSVLKAQDDRQAIEPGQPDSYPCHLGLTSHKAMLLSIDDLTRSSDPAEIAISHVTYAAPEAVAAACKKNHFEAVKGTAGVVQYILKNDVVVAITPVEFSATDY